MIIRCSPGRHPKCPKQQFQMTDCPPIELMLHSKMSLPLKLAFSQDLRFQSTFNFFFNLGGHRSCRPLSEFRKAEVDLSYSVPVGCVSPYVVMKPPLEEARDTASALPLFCTHSKETLLFCNICILGPAGNLRDDYSVCFTPFNSQSILASNKTLLFQCPVC